MGQGPISRMESILMSINRSGILLAALLIFTSSARAADDVVIASPGGNVQFKLLLNERRPRFSVMLKDATVLEPSPIIMTIDDKVITDNVQVGNVERYTRDESYPY